MDNIVRTLGNDGKQNCQEVKFGNSNVGSIKGAP